MEDLPWVRFLVDLIRPYKIIREGHDDPLILKYLTMADPTTVWFEIIGYNNNQEAII